jgi:hypothetical protein
MKRGDFESAWRLSDQATGEHLYDGQPLGGKRGPRTPLETARVIEGLDLVISADTFFCRCGPCCGTTPTGDG